MTTQSLIKTSKITALLSFICGTIIFATYYLTSNSIFLFIGYGYILIVGIINLILLILLVSRSFSDPESKRKIFTTIGIQILNLPILFLYCWISIILLGTMRINFINATNSELTHIKIIGCEPKQIDKLMPQERKIIWIGITGDCTIQVEYKMNGQIIKETVAGYVTSGMGQKMIYKIGGDNFVDF